MMPMLDTGFFLLLTVMAFLFMSLSIVFRNSSAGGVFNILSLVIFFSIALFMVSDYSIGSTTIITEQTPIIASNGTLFGNATSITTHTDYFINSFDGQTMVGLIFLVLGIFNSCLAFFSLMPRTKEDDF